MNYLIGSRALNFHNKNFQITDKTDWDVISDKPVCDLFEHHCLNFLNNDCLQQYSTDIIKHIGVEIHVVNLLGLSLIKRSHLWRNLSFEKHITHYHKYLNLFSLTDKDKLFLKNRTQLSLINFKEKHPSLNKTKEQFFNDDIVKKYDHDYLHDLVAFYQKPIYSDMLLNTNSVFCSEDKWKSFSFEKQLLCVVEETLVIALERFIIPNNWKYPFKLAYLESLKKVCTTLSSGWFRDFAIDNYPKLVNKYDSSIFNKIKLILKAD